MSEVATPAAEQAGAQAGMQPPPPGALRPGGQLAVQVPANGDHPRILEKAGESPADNTLTPPNAVTRPCRSITIWVASWRISAASWLT